MAWRCSSSSNKGLIDNLWQGGIVKSPRVRDAMLQVDRGYFAPGNPYADAPQDLGMGSRISAPHMHSYALESLEEYLKPGNSVLDIGSGSGYLVAVMSRMVCQPGKEGKVIGIEHINELTLLGQQSFKKALPDGQQLLENGQVEFISADGRQGYPGGGILFDAIHVGGAIPVVPQELINQIKSPGRIFIPVGDAGEPQYVYEITKDEKGTVNSEKKFGVSYVPLGEKEFYYRQGSKVHMPVK
ncbi:protein-L-isoaspartate O-methyltransferase [Dipodascopsis uninucleata]